MSFKLSDRFLEAVADAAEKLSEEHPVVPLDGIYSMFQVRLQMAVPDLKQREQILSGNLMRLLQTVGSRGPQCRAPGYIPRPEA